MVLPVPQSLQPSLGRRSTARLSLAALGEDDWNDFRLMHEDRRVVATLGGLRPVAEVRALFDRLVRQWSDDGIGWWSARDRSSGDFLGRGGLRRVSVEGEPVIEVGYGFVADAWGRGLATELATESLLVADQMLELPEVVGITLETNAASRRVLERVGLSLRCTATHAALPHVLYSRLRPTVT